MRVQPLAPASAPVSAVPAFVQNDVLRHVVRRLIGTRHLGADQAGVKAAGEERAVGVAQGPLLARHLPPLRLAQRHGALDSTLCTREAAPASFHPTKVGTTAVIIP